MNYEQMMQIALRGVVRDAIRRVIREDGLPGAHHFYITFLTRFPGAEIDEGLAKKYPKEITIVLEHKFWDLSANDKDFEVTLKFGGVPKYLRVPYAAVTRFHDPSVGFALQFNPPGNMEERPASPRLATLEPTADETENFGKARRKASKAGAGIKMSRGVKNNKKDNKTSEKHPEDDTVVSMDTFRKNKPY
ncbi:MAG: hypothetical protein GDA35_06205 [Hyphomonadaceae bacterium]|nr:hypothetical protein [Hyphomonadaceae bacterium]